MSLFAEVWTRPGDSAFGRLVDDAPWVSMTFHDGINLVGDGSGQLPDTYDTDDLIFIDLSNPALCTRCLVRIYSEADPSVPIAEWLPNSILPAQSKDDHIQDIGGRGIKSILSEARTEAFDWDGSDDWESRDPDWQYGGFDKARNGSLEDSPLGITNPGFEDGTRIPWWPGYEGVAADADVQTAVKDTGTYALEVTPLKIEGGTSTSFKVYPSKGYTVTARIRGASGVDYQMGASGPVTISPGTGATYVEHSTPGGFGLGHTYEAQLQFTGSGAFGTETLIFYAGQQNHTQLSVREGEAVLDGSDFYVDVVTLSGFGVGTDGWEPSQGMLDDINAVFEASSDFASEGSYSLKISALPDEGPYQKFSSIEPGVTYTATVKVRGTAASPWSLQVVDVQGNVIGQSTQTVSTGGFTEFTVTFKVPDFLPGATGDIFIGIVNADTVRRDSYMDELVFFQGLPPTTIGAILGDLYADAVSDHSAVRVVWEDESNPGTSYLSLDFSDSVDSNGAAWVDPEISIKIWMRMSYLQVMDQFARSWGYEWRIVPDDPEAGTWLWQVYNPGTMKTDYSSAQSPAIQGGASDVVRSIRKFLPDGTDVMVEGLDRVTSRDRDSDLVSALGRIESSRLDRELPDLPATIAAAFEDKTDVLVGGLTFSYNLVNPQDEPLTDYQLGDLLTVHDPPDADATSRFMEVTLQMQASSTEWDVDFAPATAAGS